ncbi:hypothetical protein ACU686_01060 [Yinghuangia aomiensis]
MTGVAVGTRLHVAGTSAGRAGHHPGERHVLAAPRSCTRRRQAPRRIRTEAAEALLRLVTGSADLAGLARTNSTI